MVRRRVLAAAFAIAMLAACGGSPEPEPTAGEEPTSESPAEPDPTSEPAESPESPEPSEPSEDEGVPALDELIVRTGGVGPLTVGVAPASNPGAAMIEHDPDACAEFAEPGAAADRWVVSAYPDGSDTAYHGDPVAPLHVDADEDAVHRIDVLGVTPRTEEGVGVGTPTEELRATYPDLEGPYDNMGISQVWWLTGDDGTLVFETQGEYSGLRDPSEGDTVILMRVLEAGESPEWGAANSGNVAGSCL